MIGYVDIFQYSKLTPITLNHAIIVLHEYIPHETKPLKNVSNPFAHVSSRA